MIKTDKMVLLFYISIILVYFNSTISYAKDFNELSTEILKKSNAEVEQYGLRYEFSDTDNGKLACSELFNELYDTWKKDINTTIYENNDQYCIQFYSENESGYIQYYNGKVVIDISQKKTFNDFKILKIRIDKIVNTKNSSPLCYSYIKAKIGDTDKLKMKNIILTILKKSGASNIKSTDVSKGYSITAFTGSGTPTKVGDEYVDINCVVCSYESGDYLLIGVPIINTCY